MTVDDSLFYFIFFFLRLFLSVQASLLQNCFCISERGLSRRTVGVSDSPPAIWSIKLLYRKVVEGREKVDDQ